MTREERIAILKDIIDGEIIHPQVRKDVGTWAIEALEQDTVPFDFELYQMGLMDMPKEMIKVLDKIRAEIIQEYNRLSATRADETLELGECLGLKMALKIIDKYKEESEVDS